MTKRILIGLIVLVAVSLVPAAAASASVQWDAKFGVSAPLWSGPRLKVNATGELFVPLTRSPDPADAAATLLTSRTLRFGIVTAF